MDKYCGGKRGRFPRHRAAASLKPCRAERLDAERQRFPRHRAAASLKPGGFNVCREGAVEFSAASGRGLIEARRPPTRFRAGCRFSAASGRGLIEARQMSETKRMNRQKPFSAASGRGLIEAWCGRPSRGAVACFPRHRAAASLKLTVPSGCSSPRRPRFPRHRAAASLKPTCWPRPSGRRRGFPRHRAAASLKPG